MPLPLYVLGAHTYVIPLVGKPERWSRFVNRYIEAKGRITRLPEGGDPGIGMEVTKATEVGCAAQLARRIPAPRLGRPALREGRPAHCREASQRWLLPK